jgi:hypothetical protein
LPATAPAQLLAKITNRAPRICLYGLAPPKLATPAAEIVRIAEQQMARLGAVELDGLVVYDIQDETERVSDPRPFPFLPTIPPEVYVRDYLGSLPLPKIVYRSVGHDRRDSFLAWLRGDHGTAPRFSVLVGAPTRQHQPALALADAYDLCRAESGNIVLGGIAIAERHGRAFDEHLRILSKIERGCRFFVTQAVYDVTSTKSLLSDYALAMRERSAPPVPIILTFSPCGSLKTLAFMKWLGIAFPRWLENELRSAPDPLATSIALCHRVFDEIWDYAREKGIPIGVNVESVSTRKSEIEASFELLGRLQAVMRRGP